VKWCRTCLFLFQYSRWLWVSEIRDIWSERLRWFYVSVSRCND